MNIITNKIGSETDSLINRLWLSVQDIAPKGTKGYAEKLIHPTTGLTACQIVDTPYYKKRVLDALTEDETKRIEEMTKDWNETKEQF